ncbi:DUF3103 family protein [Lentzea sp. NPDC051213]|uniref:DUF3103 family protein n=1 Tax=Lentzea sp. NPDC051213 TaxID=3364126 RepID=UPI003796753B
MRANTLRATLVALMVAAAVPTGTATAAPANVSRILDQLALDLAKANTMAVLHNDPKVVLAERRIAVAKGLPDTQSLITARRVGGRSGEVLVAAAPDDDQATKLKAYDRSGKAHELTTAREPGQPVLLLDIDVERAVRLGMDVIKKALPAPMTTQAAGYWATQVTRVRLSDVQEPWFKGDAEIFTLVSGFGLDGKVRVDPVTMPYLDEEDTTYSPNQLIVHWNNYKYDLADVVMMEDDGDTNYKALAQALVAALLTIVDGGAYIPLVSAVLDAIPDSWYTDDPDYVESWYTLNEQGGGVINGASARGWMETRPYWVREL